MNITPKLMRGVKSLLSLTSKLTSAEKVEKTIIPSKFDRVKTAAEKFTIGFGKVSILPRDVDTHTYYIAGYGDNNPAKGVLDSPYAHAVWLDDNSGHGGVAFISVDAVGMLNKDVNALRASLADFCKTSGCRSVNLMCTHNHAGIDTMGNWGKLPKSGRDPKYMDLVFDACRAAVRIAYADRRDGQLYLGKIEVPDMQEDIRLPIVYSKTLTRLRFVPDDGSRQVYMLNFASHSESLQGSNNLVSADFPGYMRDEIREKTGAETIYFVGAIGGMISMELLDEVIVESTKKIGRKLAGYALEIKDEIRLEPKISFVRQEFFFEAENIVLLLAKKAKILNADGYKADWSSSGLALKSEMSYFEIGSQKLLLLPCELFPELAYGGYLPAESAANKTDKNPTPLVDMAGDKDMLFFGLANDEVGYVIPPNDFLLDKEMPYMEHAHDDMGRKHYEETNSIGPGTADRIAEVFGVMLDSIKS